MGALMRAKDWAATPLGSPEAWPQSLKTVVRILLTSRYAMWMGWGPELTFLYNDAYAPMTLGASTRGRSGRPAREVWAEIWADIGPRVDSVLGAGAGDLGRGAAAVPRAQRLPGGDLPHLLLQPAARRRRRASAACSASSPRTPSGSSASAALAHAARARRPDSPRPRTEAEVCAAVELLLGANPRDLPFALIYLFDDEDGAARLACRTAGLAAGAPGRPGRHRPGRIGAPGRSPAVLAGRGRSTVDDLGRRFAAPARRAPGTEPPQQAVVAADRAAGPGRARRASWSPASTPTARSTTPTGGFLDLSAGQIAAGARQRAAPTRRSAGAPRRWPRSTAPRPRSSRTSATSSARR